MKENEEHFSLALINSTSRVGEPPRCIPHRNGSKRKHITTMATSIKPIPTLTEKNKLNFWKKVDRFGPTMPHMQTPCWLWTGYNDRKGYGIAKLHRKPFLSHRIAFVLSNGVFSEQKANCLHKCDNPSCNNPQHLFAGSIQDNASDMIAKGRKKPNRGEDHWSRFHPERIARGDNHHNRLHPEKMARGENSGACKLTGEQCKYIRESPLTGAAIARKLGVSRSQISNIRRGKSRILPNPPK